MIFSDGIKKNFQSSANLMMQHYKHLQSRDFFDSYIKYMTSGPVILMVNFYNFFFLNLK